MNQEEYVTAIRRHLKRVQIALCRRDEVSLRYAIIQSFFGIVEATERYTGAQIGVSEMYKPLILAATANADDVDSVYSFLDQFVSAIDDRQQIWREHEREKREKFLRPTPLS